MASEIMIGKTPRTKARRKAAYRVSKVLEKEQEKQEFEAEKAEVENYIKHHLPRKTSKVKPIPGVVKFVQEQAYLQQKRKEKQCKLQEKLESIAAEKQLQLIKEAQENLEKQKLEKIMKIEQQRLKREIEKYKQQPGIDEKMAIERIKEFKRQNEKQKNEAKYKPKKREQRIQPKYKPLVRKTSKVTVDPKAVQFCAEQAKIQKERQERMFKTHVKTLYKTAKEEDQQQREKESQLAADRLARQRNMERKRMEAKRFVETETLDSRLAMLRVKEFQQQHTNPVKNHSHRKISKVTNWR